MDGLACSQDGMAIDPGALVDKVSVIHHDNWGTANPSFTNENATLVLQFDLLALTDLTMASQASHGVSRETGNMTRSGRRSSGSLEVFGCGA